MRYIIFSFDGVGFPVAKKLRDEGADVTVVQIEDRKDIDMPGTEDPEKKRRRLSIYDGVFEKMPLKIALETMRGISDKQNWFVWFDTNDLWKVSEEVEKMGFEKGLFVRKTDLDFEADRNMAKEFVQRHYDNVEVAETMEFDKVKDAIDFLKDTDKVWVLKGNSEFAKTKVPDDNDPYKARMVLIDLLQSHVKEYENGGFILEEKIIGGLEITPEIIFWDGEPVCASLDFENKPKGAGNEGIQLGCAQNLICRIELEDKIAEIAFPKRIYDEAKNRKGIFIWDCGLMMKGDTFYFTEFCSQRFGYDSLFTEMAMAGGAMNFFEKIAAGNNPLMYRFGAAVRGLNEHRDDQGKIMEDIPIMWDPEYDHDIWVYEMRKDSVGDYISTGASWDLAVFTGAGDDIEMAVAEAYCARGCFTFDSMITRPRFDFMSRDYLSSIPNRFSAMNHMYFDLPDLMENEHSLYMMRLGEMQKRFDMRESEDDMAETE